MHPEVLKLLLVPGSAVKALFEHTKLGPAVLEGACALVASDNNTQLQQQQTAPPSLSLVRINKVHSTAEGSYQLEVIGGGPELQATQPHVVATNSTLQGHPSSKGNVPSATGTGAGNSQASNILSTSACMISLDQVTSIHPGHLQPRQFALLCILLAARLALRAELPDQEKVYKRACQLKGALMHAAARKQGRQPTSKEVQALADWQQETHVGKAVLSQLVLQQVPLHLMALVHLSTWQASPLQLFLRLTLEAGLGTLCLMRPSTPGHAPCTVLAQDNPLKAKQGTWSPLT
jgi:hypothetical protein